MEKYNFQSEPLANSESIVTGPNYRFTLVSPMALRLEWASDGIFEDRASTFAINRNFPKPTYHVNNQEAEVQITTSSFQLTYDKQRFSPNGLLVTFTSKVTDWGSEWRYGSRPHSLGGTARTLDGVDGRCDMGSGILSRSGYSALDDSESMLFDEHGFVCARRPGDRVDIYIFFYGHDYEGAMKTFYAISGRQPVVPRWCLGNWWSRYYAYNSTEYLKLVDEFKARQMPLSVGVIDMDWHLVKGDEVPHVGWTGYTWNKSLFPDPVAFMKELHDRGLKITLNDHPHAGIHSHEDMYERMARALGHDISQGAPILFEPTCPKYMHAFLNVVHRDLEKQGCDFWWIDWQQGSISKILGVDPLWLLNHFQFLDSSQHSDMGRAIIFSRYAGPGSHRYPVGFSGDSVATWESLRFQPEFTATASNIGYGWWSHDIGGHCAGSRDDELAVRWVQYGAFSPILRFHSSASRWMSKEPWRYRHESEVVMRKFLQLRHRLIPYIFSINAAPSEADRPLIRPMYWAFPSLEVSYQHPNQYYFGSSLIVSPVVHPREPRTNLAKTKIWVPPGRYVDILTGFVYDGDRETNTYRSLHEIPVFASEGSIIPLDRELVPANGCGNPNAFEVLVVVGQDCKFSIIEDCQDDQHVQAMENRREIPITYEQASGRLRVPASGRAWTFRFIALLSTASPIRVQIGESPSTEATVKVENFPKLPSTIIELPIVTDPGSAITLDLGPDPQVSIIDHTAVASRMVEDFQIDNNMKDNIWAAVGAHQPTSIKMSRILSLGLEEDIVGPLIELLSSDSRAGYGSIVST
jgi:alpha-glucosidase (family GH31 glycosyl hydrolase)